MKCIIGMHEGSLGVFFSISHTVEEESKTFASNLIKNEACSNNNSEVF